MNIYLNEENHSFLKKNISHGKISWYVNQAIAEKNVRDRDDERKNLISAYQAMQSNHEAKSDKSLLEESSRKISYE